MQRHLFILLKHLLFRNLREMGQSKEAEMSDLFRKLRTDVEEEEKIGWRNRER